MNSKWTENSSLKNASTQTQRELIQGQLSMGKLIFLGGLSIILSVFGPLSLLAPVPLTMAFLLYGRMKALYMGLGIAFVLWGLSLSIAGLAQLGLSAGVFSLALIYALAIQTGVEKKQKPMKILLKTGGLIIGLWALFIFAAAAFTGFQLRSGLTEVLAERIEFFKTDEMYSQQFQTLQNSSAPEAKLLLDTLEKPEVIVDAVLSWAPGSIFVGTFFSVWLCLFIVMRNSLIWRPLWNYPHSVLHMTKFRMPDVFVWPLIVGLVLFLGSEYIEFSLGEILGGNLLIGLALFYFFQGFGIVIDSFAYFNIMGLMRSVLLVLILFFAWRVVVFVGLFDTWVNFRKFLKSKDEGDKS